MVARRWVVAACGLVASVALAATALPARAADGAVKIMKSGKAGSYLADGSGKTLYTFKKDTPGQSACTGDCVAKWPLFYEQKVTAPAGIDPSAFSTITRSDGKKQTAYKGMPLYYFAGDKGAGDTSGNGVRDVWEVAKP